MKTTIRIAIILSAFFIGVTINNSCGDLPNNNPNGSIDTGNPHVDALLNSMLSEISELKSKVATLENNSGGSGDGTQLNSLQSEIAELKGKVTTLENSSGGSTEVDGMLVGPYGIANSIKKGTYYSAEGNVSSIYTYEYDNYGRTSSYSINHPTQPQSNSSYTYTYQYKKSTQTNTSTGKVSSVIEYY